MNWGKVIALGLVAGGLVGCGKQVEGPAKSAASKSTQTVKQPAKHQAKQKVIWSAIKAERLAAFMDEFADSRNQSYAKVTAKSNTTWQGVDLSGYLRDKRQVNFDRQQQAVKWLGTRAAQSAATANVVAVYADDTAGILYLFEVTPDNQGRVWVSQEAPGDGELTVKPTAATDLTDGFQQIVAGQRAHLQKPATQAAASSTSSQSKASAERQPGESSHAQVFDASFQHTWYTYSQYDSELHTLRFTGNSISSNGGNPAPVYLGRERTQEDRDFFAHSGGDIPNEERADWGAAGQKVVDGRTYVNVTGWYSMMGFGESYRVVNRTIDGVSQPVLETALGDGAWVADNYYLDPDVAEANQGTIYSDQAER